MTNLEGIIDQTCIRCGGMGESKISHVDIGSVQNIVLLSFKCNQCDFQSETVPETCDLSCGIKDSIVRCLIETEDDLMRKVLKADGCILRVPELEFEISSGTQLGAFDTVKGMLQRAVDDLDQGQCGRVTGDWSIYEAIEQTLDELRDLLDLTRPFIVELEDPKGNGYVEKLSDPDPKITFVSLNDHGK